MNGVLVKRAYTSGDMAHVWAIREQVFVQEQGVPSGLEMDEQDSLALHSLAWLNDEPIGAGRLLWLPDGLARIGRMAVKFQFRRQSIGGLILNFLEGEAFNAGTYKIELHAQSYVKAFYRLHGYILEGSPFLEAGIEHVYMYRIMAYTHGSQDADPK
jgi:predicted GNAT family N-acyltransferase